MVPHHIDVCWFINPMNTIVISTLNQRIQPLISQLNAILGAPSRAEGEEDSGFHRKLSQENQSNSLIPSPFQFASHHFELKDIPKNDRNAIHCQELEQGFPRFSIVRSNELPYFHYFPISGNQTWPSSTDNYRYIIDTSMKSQIFLYPLVIWHIAIEHGHRNSW